MDATSKQLVENLQTTLNQVLIHLNSTTARLDAVESDMSKQARSGSGLDTRLVSPLSRRPAGGALTARAHVQGQPSGSRHRSPLLGVPEASTRENSVYRDLDSSVLEENSEDDLLSVHPSDDDLYAEDE